MIDVSVLKIWFGSLGLGVVSCWPLHGSMAGLGTFKSSRRLQRPRRERWRAWKGQWLYVIGWIHPIIILPLKDDDFWILCIFLQFMFAIGYLFTNYQWYSLPKFCIFYLPLSLSLLSLPLDHSFIQVGWWLWTLTRLWLAKATGESRTRAVRKLQTPMDWKNDGHILEDGGIYKKGVYIRNMIIIRIIYDYTILWPYLVFFVSVMVMFLIYVSIFSIFGPLDMAINHINWSGINQVVIFCLDPCDIYTQTTCF